MSKKHVLIVINSLSQGGAERVASILLNRYYHDDDFDVELVLLEDEVAYDLPEGIKTTLLSSFNNKDNSMKKTLAIPFMAYKLYQYVKKVNPDLVVSFLYRADFVNVLASFLHKKPVIVSERVNASSTYDNSSLNAKINKFLIKILYPRADMVINVSKGTKQDLVENFGIDTNKQIVIYNPYDIQMIQKLSQEAIPLVLDKEKTMIAVSRFRPIKNIQMLVRAFAPLDLDTNLILVGDGSDEASLKELVKELDIEKRVYFAGGQDNPYKYMSKASLYLSSSRSEGFPNAMVEAMICGCGVVSTDCPSGPREILAPQSDSAKYMQTGVEYGEFGTLVAVDDVEAFSEALTHLLAHHDKRKHYAQKATQRVSDFTLENIYTQYTEAFSSLIESSKI